MDDLEITALPIAETHAVAGLKTIGFDHHATASQVRLSDLCPCLIKAEKIDFSAGLYFSQTPFVVGTSELYLNGLRYDLDKDYCELIDTPSNLAYGISFPGIESDDSIILKAIPVGL